MSDVGRNKLPENWETTPLSGLLIEFETGTRPKGGVGKYTKGTPSVGAEHLDANGGFKFQKIKFVPEEYADSMKRGHLQEGDILIVKDGATTAKTSIIRKSFPHADAVINEHVFRCKVTEDVDPKYVFYYLFSGKGRQEILSDFRGAAQGGISKGFADKVNIPLAPFEQQKRIVAKIEKLFSHIDAGIESLNKAKQLLKQYRQSVLKAAVTGELTKEWREANKDKLEPASQLLERILKERRQKWEEQQLEQFKVKGKMPKNDKWKEKYKEPEIIVADNEIFPRKWVVVSLDQILEYPLINGLSVKGSDNPPGVAALKLNAISNGTLDFSQRRYLPIIESDVRKLFIKKDDIFISRGNGSLHLVGRAAIADNIEMEAIFPDTMIRARIANQYYMHDLFLIYWGSGYIRSQIESAVKTTAGIWKISQAQLKKISLPLPTLEEQKEIWGIASEKLSVASRLESEVSSQLIKANKNKQSILTSAFSGYFH